MTHPHDTEIGSLLPFLLGLPAGALGGYFLRRWQEENPGQALPGVLPGVLRAPHIPGAPTKTAGDWLDIRYHYPLCAPWPPMEMIPAVGQWYDIEGPAVGQWYDIEGPAVGQWVDLVGRGGGGGHRGHHPHRRMPMQGGGCGDCQDDDDDPNMIGQWVDLVGRGGGGGHRAAHHAHHHHMQMQDGGGGDCQDQDQDGDDLDMGDPDAGYTVGGPWVDLVGSQVDDPNQRRSWPQTRGLIRSAINEVTAAASYGPAAAYVWSLDPPYGSPDPYGRVTLEGTTSVLPFGSVAEALDYMRQRIQTPHVALALFDSASTHWPSPTNWTKSNDPAYAPVIAVQAAKAGSPRMAGSHVGADSRQLSLGGALADVRSRAQTIANKRAGSVVGVIHTTKDGLWHALAFRNADDADDWFGTATQDPASYTYAAYYDKEDFQWPHPVNEKIGGPRSSKRWSV